MRFLKTAMAIASATVLVGCGQVVEVGPAEVGKVMTKQGYNEGVIDTSKYSAFVDGKPVPYCFKKAAPYGDQGSRWLFYLGDDLIADLFCDSPSSDWGVIVHGDLPHTNWMAPRLVEGFSSRNRAIDYALKIHEKTFRTYHSLGAKYDENQKV